MFDRNRDSESAFIRKGFGEETQQQTHRRFSRPPPCARDGTPCPARTSSWGSYRYSVWSRCPGAENLSVPLSILALALVPQNLQRLTYLR